MTDKEITKNPIITFALLAFNQEQFIREAIEGALSQTYSPLEIYLSDDCSSDRTFEIMKSVVSVYEGQHKVIINRNETNLGIGAHVNHVVEATSGELIVAAAGDDVSLPQRTSVTVERWLDSGKKLCSIYSRNIAIDSTGQILGEVGSSPKQGPLTQKLLSYMEGTLGCSHAWSRSVFVQFGPILEDTICEDRVIPLRSELMGGIEFIREPLVKYRVHDSNLSHFHEKDKNAVLNMAVEINRRNHNILENYLADLKTAEGLGLISSTDLQTTRSRLLEKIDEVQNKINFLQGDTNKKLGLIRSALLSNPRLAMRWLAILLFPNLYIKYKYSRPV